jgi:hypothetical protein
LACHFTFTNVYCLGFDIGNYPLANLDGSEMNPENNPNNDWFYQIKKITATAAVSGLSNIALYFDLYDDGVFDSVTEKEVYTIGDGDGWKALGYNFSTNKFTVTKFDSAKNPLNKPIYDFTFDSGAASIGDFYTHMMSNLYTTYNDSWEARASMTFLSNSMGGPQLMRSDDYGVKYWGSAIPVNRIGDIPMDQLAEIMSCVHPWHCSLRALMTLCMSTDYDAGKCILKEISLNNREELKASGYVDIDPSLITTDITGEICMASFDLSSWTEKVKRIIKRLKIKCWYY